jgi:hypothetical protein
MRRAGPARFARADPTQHSHRHLFSGHPREARLHVVYRGTHYSGCHEVQIERRRLPHQLLLGKEVRTVLIIEDEPALLELLAKTLVSKGFQVLPAATGRRGIEFAIGTHPDVIILDTKRIPILLHTGTALNEQERQHLASHVQSVTSKAEPQSLFANLERLQGTPAETVGQE